MSFGQRGMLRQETVETRPVGTHVIETLPLQTFHETKVH